LKDQWSPALTLKTALLSVQALLSAPQPDDPQDAVVAQQVYFILLRSCIFTLMKCFFSYGLCVELTMHSILKNFMLVYVSARSTCIGIVCIFLGYVILSKPVFIYGQCSI
jgi:hypothetical protein